ncbi:MAG: DarT ssDNA thymidine ADP-ribosyltransferase family protein [Anaerolineae bacterium]|nr:DarT ssDNA thymidine ADP-ribosyltransferase family protein [Anaerolineae bacterium]MDW8173397.1 DarT ssDNA thymidine ADP-ribosyltransferase family protein [Anaerolineae bacterium]
MSDTLNIFISYGRKDSTPFALRLRDDLEALGWRVWLDQSEIDGGDDWMSKIERAIEGCDLMLALISPHANESRWCKAEQLRALRKGKPIIPLLLFAEAEPPLHLEASNYLDFTQAERYADRLRDLVSDLRTRQAMQLRTPHPEAQSASAHRQTRRAKDDPFAARRKAKVQAKPSYAPSQHRQAASLRRALRELQAEDWGARQWWTFFAFYYGSLPHVAEVLRQDSLNALPVRGRKGRYDDVLRLSFRPRTPATYAREGHRPVNGGFPPDYVPIPVYLGFELEDLLLREGVKFSDGDAAKVGRTYSTAQAFRDLPFRHIYHDTWFSPDEREEILRHREAQLLVPSPLGLEALQMIALRSAAEYDTLRHYLPTEIWRRWRDKILVRPDLALFHQRRVYVQRVTCTPTALHVACHAPADDVQPCTLSLLIRPAQGQPISERWEGWLPAADWRYDLPERLEAYEAELRLDDELAYSGALGPTMSVF